MSETSSPTLIDRLNKGAPHAHWLPRIGIAAIFLFHGFDKIGNVGGFAEMMGLNTFVAWLVTFGELGIGLAILAGGTNHAKADHLTRIAGAIMVVIMAGAIKIAHWPTWHFMKGGMEFQFLLVLVGIAYVLTGNGNRQSS